MDLLAALDVFYKLVSLALVGTVVLLDLGFYALVTALTLAGFIWFASSFLISRRFWSINVRRTSARMQSLVRDSFGVWLVTIVGLLHFQGDMVLLSLLQPPEDVGIYAIAYKFIEQSFLIPGLLMSAIFPILVKRMQESREQSEELIRKAFLFLLLVGIPLALTIFIMADRLVSLVASETLHPPPSRFVWYRSCCP